MGIKFFGHYLFDEGKLEARQLSEAVDYQNSKNLSLGEIAVREKLLTPKNAELINHKQQSLDKRFGEVAMSLDLLTEIQITELLKIQKREKVFFGEILVLKGFMSEELVNKELNIFNEQQKTEAVELDEKIDDIDQDTVMKNTISVLKTLYSRVVHDHIKLVAINDKNKERSGVIALQKMRGDVHLDFALQTEDSLSFAISKEFIKTDFHEIDEIVLDIVCEFVNIVLGNIAVKFSERSIKVELTPPSIISRDEFKVEEYHSFDFTTTHGNLTLYLKL